MLKPDVGLRVVGHPAINVDLKVEAVVGVRVECSGWL